MNLNEADLYNLHGKASAASREVKDMQSDLQYLRDYVERLEKQIVRSSAN